MSTRAWGSCFQSIWSNMNWRMYWVWTPVVTQGDIPLPLISSESSSISFQVLG